MCALDVCGVSASIALFLLLSDHDLFFALVVAFFVRISGLSLLLLSKDSG